MIVEPNADPEAAEQYLLWALEIIERAGNKKAAEHARKALEALREGGTHQSTGKTNEQGA